MDQGERPHDTPLLEENLALARLLDQTAELLETQNANRFRVQAYRIAATEIRALRRDVRELHRQHGREALQEIPHIGESLSRAIETWLLTGTLGIFERLRGEEGAERTLMSVPGIGRDLAHRIHHELHVASLEALELAAHDGRLAELEGIGPRRLQAICDLLEVRLHRRVRPPAGDIPTVRELLEVDREYRERGEAGELPTIAPKRFNPGGDAWLPVLHTHRNHNHYTALYSNTARAHQLDRTRDWVVIYLDDGIREHQWTVVTEQRGPLTGRRVVRGREEECVGIYAAGNADCALPGAGVR